MIEDSLNYLEPNPADNLGKKAKDRITGFKGVIITIVVHVTGCIQYGVRSQVNNSNESKLILFDGERLIIGKRVMEPVKQFRILTEKVNGS